MNEIAEMRGTQKLIAPLGTSDVERKWEGRAARKSWDYRVTATLAHLQTPELLSPCIELLRLQTERPYIVIVDTGSSPAVCQEIEGLRADDVEIHYVRAHDYRHSSAPVGVAQDLAFALCRTEYLYCTHADCFLRRRDYVEQLMRVCDEAHPAIGYQMSPRDWLTDQWEGMVSHTATLLHMPTMHRHGVTWSFERAHWQFGIPRGATMGWPDTETCFNLCLRAAGLKPVLIGAETNYERHKDSNVDHPRSFAGSLLYAANYHETAATWMREALAEAGERIGQWKNETVRKDAARSEAARGETARTATGAAS